MIYDLCQYVQLTEGWASSSVVTPSKKKGNGKKKKEKEPLGFYQRKREEKANAR